MNKLLRDRRGANLVEYIILVGVVALMSIAAFKAFQFRIRGKSVQQSQAVQNDITNK
jgi:Flp pilus assembly pilin Flp